jgi:DNA-binding IscR family transcriptional regulator
MAAELRTAEPELLPVLRRLQDAGLVGATAGSPASFGLGRSPAEGSLLEIYEAIDGPLGCDECLLGEPTCQGEACILGDLIKSVNEQMRTSLSTTRLADVTQAYRAQATGRGA